MYKQTLLLMCISVTFASSQFFSFEKLKSYAKLFDVRDLPVNGTGNELWNGLMRDCKKSITFSCIQKNAYTYLDNTFTERDNITVFDGLVLKKNSLNYQSCERRESKNSVDENIVENSNEGDRDRWRTRTDESDCENEEHSRGLEDEASSPLEEVTTALRKKTVKFLATRDYEIQLPDFFFEGASFKISPKEIDANGALIRVDFGERAVESRGRLFKKIRKMIQNKLLMSFLALLLIIKLIKLKFMFVLPFLFGIGTAKKLFLKLLLFMVPAFAHVFKLCSSYYSNKSPKLHHHHHQIAHHHHHVPVPVPVPAPIYVDHPPHQSHHSEEEFNGYDYAHPHIQYRKDMEELKEWGIEPYEEQVEDVNQHLGPINPTPMTPVYTGSYDVPQYASDARPVASHFPDKPQAISAHAQNLAYSGYMNELKANRQRLQQAVPGVNLGTVSGINPGPGIGPGQNIGQGPNIGQNLGPVFVPGPIGSGSAPVSSSLQSPQNTQFNVPSSIKGAVNKQKSPYSIYAQQQQYQQQQQQRPVQGQRVVQIAPKNSVPESHLAYDDDFYGPIVGRLDETFGQLRFLEENCRERLVCSMYKNPAVYTPHSNLVSNELSRDPQELKRGNSATVSSQRFHRYLNAARLGQDGGDCLRTYPCHINTE